VDNAVLFLLMVVFVPLYFFASMYSQLALGYDSSDAGLYLLLFFAGFAVASQFGGRILDSRGWAWPCSGPCSSSRTSPTSSHR
jgi:hypothetical protein